MRGAIVIVILLTVVAAAQQPRQTAPTFRTTTRLIVQTVVVRDGGGKPIEGLTAKDFSVTEDGEPQEIAFVEFQRLDGERLPQVPGTASPEIQPRIESSGPRDPAPNPARIRY